MENKPQDMYRTQTTRNWPSNIIIAIKDYASYFKEADLKYATNPHHAAAIFNPLGNMPLFVLVKSGKGGPSQTNIEDVDKGLQIINSLETIETLPVAAVMKHVNPSGVSMNKDLIKSFVSAWDCDSTAAYGGTVVINKPVTEEILRQFYSFIRKRDSKNFIDNLAASSFSEDALAYLEKKESIRVFQYNKDRLKEINPFEKKQPEFKFLSDGRVILYEPYVEAVRSTNDLKIVTQRYPTESELKDMLFSWYVCAYTRSNAVVLGKDLSTLAVGTGKQERISSIKEAIEKAELKAELLNENKTKVLEGSVMASDGFIPNLDNITVLKEKGVKAIVQPGGGKLDDLVISACNESGIAMAFTEWRCFSHH